MKHSAYLFAMEVDRQIEALSASDDIRHRDRGKVLQEELLPISRLALHLKQPGLEVEVEAFESDGEADGSIRITGFREEEFKVQVTCGFTREESLRRELLISKGYTPGAGEIYRDKKSGQIIANMAGTDMEEHLTRISQSVIELFHKKAAKPYSERTALVIAFDDIKLYGPYKWHQLLALIKKAGGLSDSNFMSVYLFNSATNEIQRVA